ncbi:MAG: methylated-DNA--[protein]-cysteine S-methyltransferase [Chloroflexi bacterium]|nr:methylated-DNA--[protein]-cysteine S-methyltransferase [Chloroflexota bacterium]
MGWVGILASEKGLMAASLPRSTEKQARLELGEGMEQAVCSPRRFADLSTRFKAYFSGERVEFPDEIDLSGATPFQGEVWRTARLISYGEMRSYLWIAERIGKPGAARAVGQALGKNPLLIIIPCHRVVASNGGLGGFSGGLQVKRRLLEMENAAVIARA